MHKTSTLLHIITSISIGFIISCTPQFTEESLPANAPQAQIDGTKLSLLAKEPDIVTPTGVQVDDQNRIWVIENHTHVRQDDYPGPKVDRILVFSGYLDKDRKKKITEFATDFVDGMSLSFIKEGKVLITTRASIIQFTDTNDDQVADQRDTLISLKTEERFPHNGMSGLAVSPDGKLYFQCGENFGSAYEISGTDGTTLLGKEREGGSLYRCNLDGSNLERIGSAVWNCFAMTFDDYGNLFAVENDPDSRPPCRLLHIVKGGNYGFQFQHGRDGLSPLTSWFGQIPGTLPMVSGTGEAPSGVIYYNQDKLGSNVKGSLLVTSWGDNEIQHFQLNKKGSSFTAEAQSLVKGTRNFYPVGLAVDDKGGVIATDWANVSYAVHGAGRIWRISNPENEAQNKLNESDLISSLNSPDPRIRAKAADLVVAQNSQDAHGIALFQSEGLSDPGKMNVIWALQLADHPGLMATLELALKEENELIRAAAVRTIIEHDIVYEETFFLNLVKNDPSPFVKREAIYGLGSQNAFESVVGLFKDDDPFIHTALIYTFGREEHLEYLLNFASNSDADIRLGAFLCLRHSETERAQGFIIPFLNDSEIDNRITALKWVAEDHLKKYRTYVERSFNNLEEITPNLFDAYMVTFQYLDGEFNQRNHFMEGDAHISRSFYKRQKFLLATAQNPKLNYHIRARALSGINPNHESLNAKRLQQFTLSPNEDFQVEAVRSLSARTEDPNAINLLPFLALKSKFPESVRLEAIIGLANTVSTNEKSKNTLLKIAANKQETQNIREEAMRGLQLLISDPAAKPWIEDYKKILPKLEDASNPEFWRKVASEKGNSLAGASVFHNPRYQCASCHRVNGRGGIVGPDLSQVGSNADRERIIESILNPSDIVTPAYTGYSIVSKDGSVTVGRLDKDLDSKRHLQMILTNGERTAVAYDEIAEQNIMPQSLMPQNLHLTMTVKEFRDLIEFLAGQR